MAIDVRVAARVFHSFQASGNVNCVHSVFVWRFVREFNCFIYDFLLKYTILAF